MPPTTTGKHHPAASATLALLLVALVFKTPGTIPAHAQDAPTATQTPAKPATTPLAKTPADSTPQTPSEAKSSPNPSPRLPHNSGILLDPAHGGDDPGARLAPDLLEKDLTLALAARLKPALEAKGLTTRSTRDSDTAITAARRNAVAQAADPIACLSLHATGSGTGVHIYTALPPITDLTGSPLLSWSQVQADILPESRALATLLQHSFAAAGLQATVGEAAVSPLAGYACPAVAIEAAPPARGAASTLSDTAYQQRVAEAVAAALAQWRSKRQAAP